MKPDRVYFGTFRKGKSPVKYIELVGTDSDNTKITKVETAGKNSFIKTDISPQSTVEISNKKIKLTVLPDAPVGKLRERIIIYTDHEKIKKMTVYAYGEVQGDIAVHPKYLSLGHLDKNKKIVKTIKLDSAGETSFKVLKVSSTEPEVKAEVETVKEGKSYLVKVFPVNGYTRDILKGEILIQTDNNEQKDIKVKFFGRVRHKRVKKKAGAQSK